MAINTRITELFGIEYPLNAAGMVWVSGWKLAAAVSNAGGLGLIGAGSMKPDLLREHIRKIKSATTKPWGVNLPLTRGDVEELLAVIFDEGVRIIFTSSGNPAVFAPRLKEKGMTVVHVVAAVKHARKAEAAGCDAVVAEGFEAGGHNGFDEITTLALVPQVVDAVTIPVIAAGGIADGRQMLACMALGAEGVQIGTAFAATAESSAHERYKQSIIEADDGATVLTMKKVSPLRMLKTPFALKVMEAEAAGRSKEELRELNGKGRERMGIFEGNWEEGEFEMGQSSGLVKEILPACELVRRFIREYEDAKKNIA
ncbi:MAG: NAD(P)H-dependent flavin oxidoreductase [Acidobacteriota bacterium]